jgi:rhamnopyranosyl-N-acetylglucosaminyl-diphospho-decaprenol beta-1,3/1,4-galactofuranosyltransferase
VPYPNPAEPPAYHLSMSDSLKIAAVFATMNRAETARKCVLALARQTRPPELVVVADNCSTDDTAGSLERLADLPFQLVVHRMPENRGNAGGVETVMDLAFAEGADAVWILDDDSWPRDAALEALLEGPWDPRTVRHALQVDPKTKSFTWPMWVDGGSGWKLVFAPVELPEGDLIPSKSSWTGALIPKQIRKQVGPVNGALFIRGEDEEYPWRIGREGYAFAAIRGAVMDHPGPDDLIHWYLLGKHFFFERGLPDWKLHYKIRNMVWLKRRQSGAIRALSMAFIYTIAVIGMDRGLRVGLVWKAARDGWLGKLGKWEGQ